MKRVIRKVVRCPSKGTFAWSEEKPIICFNRRGSLLPIVRERRNNENVRKGDNNPARDYCRITVRHRGLSFLSCVTFKRIRAKCNAENNGTDDDSDRVRTVLSACGNEGDKTGQVCDASCEKNKTGCDKALETRRVLPSLR